MLHKKFTLETIAKLMENAHTHKLNRASPSRNSSSQSTREANSTTVRTPSASQFSKRQRLPSGSVHAQFPQRKTLPIELHNRIALKQNTKGACVVCSHNFSTRKADGKTDNWEKFMKRTKMVCGYCTKHSEKGLRCYLCKEHFVSFHNE